MIRCATKGVRIEICIYKKIIKTGGVAKFERNSQPKRISINSQKLRTAISDTPKKIILISRRLNYLV